MDSKIHGVPLSATQGTPLFTPTSGIRAPLTVDDDSDFEYSNGQSYNNSSTSSYYGSDTGFESDGFVSGEDGFETASERAELDDKNTIFSDQIVGSRPFVKAPVEETVVLGSSLEDYDDSRSSLTDPNGETLDIASATDEYSVKPVVLGREIVEGNGGVDIVEESVGSNKPFDEVATESSDSNKPFDGVATESSGKDVIFSGVADVGEVPARGIPIAQLSWDSEDEYLSTGVPEDNDVSGAVRIPNGVVLERIDSIPKVRVSDVSDGEEDVSETGSVEQSGLAEEDVLGFDRKEEDEAEIDTVQNFVLEGSEAANDSVGGEKVAESNLLGQESSNDAKVLAEASQILDSSADANSDDLFNNKMPSDSNYSSSREEVRVSNFGNDEEASGDSLKFESKGKEEIYPNSSSDVPWSSVVEDNMPKLSDEKQHREACLNSDIETDGEDLGPVELIKNEDASLVHETDETLSFKGSDRLKLIGDQLDHQIDTADYDGEVTQDHLPRVDGEIVIDSDGEVDTEDEDGGREVFDARALAALLMAAAGVGPEGKNVSVPLANGAGVFPSELLNSVGSRFHSFRPAQSINSDSFTLSENSKVGTSEEILSEEERARLDKLQRLKVKFLRLVQRLNRSPEDSVAAQVLYQLVLAAGKSAPHASSLDSAQKEAMELEEKYTDGLKISLNILVIGKTGVGKSATINSIVGDTKAKVDAFAPATTKVKEIVGQLNGVTLRILDTPGLRSSQLEQSINRRTLLSIKKCMRKCPPDVVLYVDRFDAESRDLGDLPLLKSISSYLGPSIWRNAIVTLTHAASSPPDGPSGYPVSYEMFVGQRSRIIQRLISHSVDDFHVMSSGMMNPFSLVENHSLSPKNDKGEILLPNGENWRSQLLLLCYSMKILTEIDSVVKDKGGADHRKLFSFPMRSLPLPYFLSSLLQSNVHPKLSNSQGGDDNNSDIEMMYSSDSDQEVEEDYEDLPPFKPLRKSQIAQLSKEQKRAYFDEYDYRVKLLQKKQLKEVVKRVRNMKKNGKKEMGYYTEEGADQETESAAGVAVPLPDMVLPNSFDGDNPAYRYRSLEHSSQLLARPVMDSHGWDHDCGYDGVSVEDHLAVADQFPAVIALQIKKDKKEFNIHLDSSVSAKTSERGSTMVGFDIQTVGKQLAYILKGETKVKNLKRNSTAGAVSVTFLGDNLVTGLKLEDQFAIGKQLVVVGSTGTIRSRGNSAYGANLELRLREKDYPVGQDQSSLGLSLMKWRNDIIWGCNLQSQFSVGRNSKIAVRAGLNNRRSGQISVKTSTSDQLQIVLLGLLPIARAIMGILFPQTSEKNLV